MWATASRVPSWLLIEVPGAWGRDAVVDSDLGGCVTVGWREALRIRRVRVLTVRRDVGQRQARSKSPVRLVYVIAGRPGRTAARAWRAVVDGLTEVVEATEALVTTGECGSGWEEDDELYALVCTNGRHDPCCATLGRPVARGLRDSRWADQVWECSHIGGDRFAGNLLLLPESLYFGRCDADTAKAVLDAYEAGRIELPHYRGRSTLGIVEQAAEHFVRTEFALDRLDAIASIETLNPGGVLIRTAHDGRDYVVTVERGNSRSPTPLTCRGPDGQRYPRFRLGSINRKS